MKDSLLPPVKPIPILVLVWTRPVPTGRRPSNARGVIGGMIHSPLEGVGRQLEAQLEGSWKDPCLSG
jgi:hypothetical protein